MADLIDRKAARQIVAAYSTAEGVEKALNAIAALPAQGVRVRGLEWGRDGKAWSAKTAFGEYRVAKVHGDWMWFFAWLPESNSDKIDKGYARSADAAKAAAQADYERRILAALEPASGGVEAHPYSLRPDLQRIVDNAKTAPQWDTERDRLTPASVATDRVEALVKAASGAILYLDALDSGGVAGPSYFAGQLRLALAAIRGGAK